MTYFAAFSPSITAIAGHSEAFGAISENIANATTTGYKTTTIQFKEQLVRGAEVTHSGFSGLSSHPYRAIGTQEPFLATRRPLDVAVNGRGFFLTNPSVDLTSEYQVTRAGEFQKTIVDEGGAEVYYLTDVGGNYVLGWPSDGNGGFTTGTTVDSAEAIRIDPATAVQAGQATTQMDFGANLPNDLTAGQTQTLSVSVFDQVGTTHQLDLTWTKLAATNDWSLAFNVQNGSVTAGTPVAMQFDVNGALVGPANHTVGLSFTNPGGGAGSIAINFSTMSQFAGPLGITTLSTDGVPPGELQDIYFTDAGVVTAQLTNGRSMELYKLALADMINPNSMVPRSGTHFALSTLSSDITLYEANLTDRAEFAPGTLELSATEIADEFGKMIMTQRAYSSATTALKTADEMIQTATNLR